MTDLRKAADLALQALDIWEDGLTDPCANFGWRFVFIGKEAQEALRQALAQAEQKKEQEPEWIDDGFGTMWQKCGKKDCGKFVVKIGKVDCWNGDCPETTAPSKREWVGLTDEQRHEFVRNYGGDVISKLALVKAIEAKLKEKNT